MYRSHDLNILPNMGQITHEHKPYIFILFYYSDMYYTVTKSFTKHKQEEIPSPRLGL